jgi:hypothetical protein
VSATPTASASAKASPTAEDKSCTGGNVSVQILGINADDKKINNYHSSDAYYTQDIDCCSMKYKQ